MNGGAIENDFESGVLKTHRFKNASFLVWRVQVKMEA